MERIKQALEKAREERQIRSGTEPAPVPSRPRKETGKIEYAQTQPVSLDVDVLRRNRIVTGLEPGPFTESYKMLRTQILHRFKENNWNVLGVTSPGEDEGKTLTAINLAISITREVEYSVLLVDANLRHPQMLEHFGLPQRKGLSDYLAGDVTMTELLIQPGPIEHLVVLPGGTPQANSGEMLNSPMMAELVQGMKNRYHGRIIIFDLPPLLTSADALAFSPYIDAALLVVEDGKTRKQDVERAVELLSTTNIVGTVLNKADA